MFQGSIGSFGALALFQNYDFKPLLLVQLWFFSNQTFYNVHTSNSWDFEMYNLKIHFVLNGKWEIANILGTANRRESD